MRIIAAILLLFGFLAAGCEPVSEVETGSMKPDAPLTNTYWKLVGIGSEPYRHSTNAREPRLRFGKVEGGVSGFTGCNDLTGGYAIDGDRLEMSEIAATRKACAEGMEVEQRFLQALARVNRFEISGDSLQLLRDDTVELEFEAVYLY